MEHGDICTVCQSTNFFEENGQYWCTECNTMSQHVTNVLLDQTAYVDPDIDVAQTEDSATEVETITDHKLTSFEIYTKILRGLTLELINLGLAPELYKVAKVLWLTYLKKCGVILNPYGLPVLPAHFQERDIQILYGVQNVSRRKIITGSSQKIKRVKKSRSSASSHFAQKKKQKQLMQQMLAEGEVASNVSESTLHLSSQFGSDAYSTDFQTDEEKVQDIKISKGAQTLLRKRRAHFLKRKNLKHPKMLPTVSLTSSSKMKKLHVSTMDIVAIVWIAIQYTSSSYLQLSDLYRLIVDGYLCLDNLEKFVPKEYRNTLSFRYSVRNLTRKSFLLRCGIICQVMEMRNIRTGDIRIVVRRYVAELALPEAILEFTDKICLLTHPPEHLLVPFSQRTLPEYDLTAMAIILVALKALFGLDDSTELELSKVADTINSHPLSSQPRQFSWSSWCWYIQCRATTLSSVHSVTHEATYSGRRMDERLAAESVQDRGVGGSRVVKRSLPGGSKRLKTFLSAGLSKARKKFSGDPLGAPMKPPLTVQSDEAYLHLWTQEILNHPYLELDERVRHILEQDFGRTSLDYLNPTKFTSLCADLNIKSKIHKGRSPLSPAYDTVPMSAFVHFSPQSTVIPKVKVNVRRQAEEVKEEIDNVDILYAAHHERIVKDLNNAGVGGSQTGGEGTTSKETEEVENNIGTEGVRNSSSHKAEGRKKRMEKPTEASGETLTLLTPRDEYWLIHQTSMPGLYGTRWKYLFKHGRTVTRAISSLCPVNFVSLLDSCASIVRSQPFHLYASVCLIELEVLGKIDERKSKLWPREKSQEEREESDPENEEDPVDDLL